MGLLDCSLPLLLLLLLFGFGALITSLPIDSHFESPSHDDSETQGHIRATSGVKRASAGATTKEPVATRGTTRKLVNRTTTVPQTVQLGWRRNCGRAPLYSDITGYIINGENATYGDFPSFARVKVVGSVFECGGVLISNRHVLTAAHCADSNVKLRIVLGDHNRLKRDGHEREFDVSRACRSPNFAQDYPGVRHDWMVLELNTTVKFNKWIQPACMPRTLPKTSGELSNCFLMGFGFSTFNESLADDPYNPYKAGITPASLQRMQVEKVICESRYEIPENDPSRACYMFADPDRNGGSCYGDSGSPVLCQDAKGLWTVTAVVSNGRYSFCGFMSASAVQTIYTNVNRVLADMDKHCKYLLVK